MGKKHYTLPELLRAARDLMNHGGKHWIKGQLRNTNTMSFCSSGAIRQVGGSFNQPMSEAVKQAHIALAEEIRPTKKPRNFESACSVIYGFNDAERRTWPEVRDAFTRAARKASRRKTTASA